MAKLKRTGRAPRPAHLIEMDRRAVREAEAIVLREMGLTEFPLEMRLDILHPPR